MFVKKKKTTKITNQKGVRRIFNAADQYKSNNEKFIVNSAYLKVIPRSLQGSIASDELSGKDGTFATPSRTKV